MIAAISAPGASIGFRVGAAVAAQVASGVATPKVTIPDTTAAGVSSTISIGAAGSVARIKVGVDIKHTYIGDLVVKLTSPGGTTAILHPQLGGSTDNLVTTYDSASPGVLTNMIGQTMKAACGR